MAREFMRINYPTKQFRQDAADVDVYFTAAVGDDKDHAATIKKFESRMIDLFNEAIREVTAHGGDALAPKLVVLHLAAFGAGRAIDLFEAQVFGPGVMRLHQAVRRWFMNRCYSQRKLVRIEAKKLSLDPHERGPIIPWPRAH